jgi:two-component system chemotaxis response regulator CheY
MAEMKTILVVDDAAFMRMRCAKLLTEHGYTVLEAGNGLEALEVYDEARPDAVLLDITMPEMDGLTTLRELKRRDPGARVAMVSAMGQQAMVMDSLRSGARDFVLKPFQPDRLLEALKKLLG